MGALFVCWSTDYGTRGRAPVCTFRHCGASRLTCCRHANDIQSVVLSRRQLVVGCGAAACGSFVLRTPSSTEASATVLATEKQPPSSPRIELILGDAPQDVRSLWALTQRVGWKNSESSVATLLHCKDRITVGIFDHSSGELVSSATCVLLGRTAAWLSYVMTHPNYRRRGYARRACERVIALADAKWNSPAIGLYGGAMAVDLYKSMGFHVVGEACVVRVQAPDDDVASSSRLSNSSSVQVRPVSSAELRRQIVTRDRELAAPVDRTFFLNALLSRSPNLSFCSVDQQGRLTGYIMATPTCDGGIFVGPLWSADLQTGRALVVALLSHRKSLLESNATIAGLGSQLTAEAIVPESSALEVLGQGLGVSRSGSSSSSYMVRGEPSVFANARGNMTFAVSYEAS
ncbi:hypothetical protein FVE85_6850 [Porphyridium purpureum]|uniref:N-acetyltransferase domain-containing protein n=1 Tax=Porphyridium purpureum TaxID=35688 RepID=A0A5J4Z7F3_PORPP|nr:hypothetical protein FVE85_6850 [Porphyridium purpureum]|eukprot:POR1576..scf295_1